MRKPTIDDVKLDLEEWRASNTKPRRPIPQELRLRILSLTDHFPKGKICRKLGINTSMLKSWSKTAEDKHEFLELKIPQPKIKPKIQLIDLTTKSGERLRIEGEFTINDITLITRAFMEASA